MPATVGDEWAIVKMPEVYRPFIRTAGSVFLGTPTISDQDRKPETRCQLVVSTDEQLYAMNVSEMLNREIRHGGYWMVSWCHPVPPMKVATEMVCRWLDVDKDVQFRVWFEGPWPVLCVKPLGDIVEACERGWQDWYEVDKHWLAVSPTQKIKAQKGERVEMPDFGPEIFGA